MEVRSRLLPSVYSLLVLVLLNLSSLLLAFISWEGRFVYHRFNSSLSLIIELSLTFFLFTCTLSFSCFYFRTILIVMMPFNSHVSERPYANDTYVHASINCLYVHTFLWRFNHFITQHANIFFVSSCNKLICFLFIFHD